MKRGRKRARVNEPAPSAKRDPAVAGDPTPLSATKTSATAEARSKKGHSYKRLPKQFRHDGFDYRQVFREGDFAIYEQTWKSNEHSAAFEVIRIRRRDGFHVGDRWVEPAEVYPNSEAWGVDGWTVLNEEAAFRKLREIAASSNALPRCATKGGSGRIEKIAHMTNGAKNHPHDKAENRPQDDSKNRPDIINPVPLCRVVDEVSLKGLLNIKRQNAWSSRVRLLGLLLLIDYICRNLKNGAITISADLAHSFTSKIRKRNSPTTITEPLCLLCAIGILQKVRPAVFAHIKTSAVYRFANPYRKRRIRLTVDLPPKLASKLKFADLRCENRLNRKYRFRKQLLADLAAVSFSPSARRIIASELSGKNFHNLSALMTAIDCGGHSVRVSERGQITTSIGSCPRELQPHLLLHGEPTVICDISNAHWNFLPLILANRLHHVSHEPGREKYIGDGWREHGTLIALLSDGDFYREWCIDPENDRERDQKKNLLNILLNQKNETCERNILYRRIRAEFPITFRIIEDIKRHDHRNLSKQLHRFTADAIAAALLEVQQKGIVAIPHVDALICQQKDRERVCEIIGRKIFEITGVCCTVAGIRYSPLTENEKQALAVDESS